MAKDKIDELVLELAVLKTKARHRGLWKTFHKLDKAEETLGHELAEIAKG